MGSVNGKSVGVFAPNNGWANYSRGPQIEVPQASFDPSRPGSAHYSVVLVVMADASTRSVSAVSDTTWSQALCPDDGVKLGKDW